MIYYELFGGEIYVTKAGIKSFYLDQISESVEEDIYTLSVKIIHDFVSQVIIFHKQ